jgi:hypothetical protein
MAGVILNLTVKIYSANFTTDVTTIWDRVVMAILLVEDSRKLLRSRRTTGIKGVV